MDKLYTSEVLQNIADAVLEEILVFFKPDTCILATRVLVDVVKYLGGEADGVSVECFIQDEAARRGDPSGVQFCFAADPRKAARTAEWRGHVVAFVGDRWLVDSTVCQASRPEFGLKVEGTIVAEAPGFTAGGLGVILENEERLTINYLAKPTDDSWREDPDWAWTTDIRDCITAAVLANLAGVAYEYPSHMKAMLALVGRF